MQQHKKFNSAFLLYLIILFGLFLRLFFFAGIGTSDDLAYSKYATNTDKDFITGSVLTLSTRFGIIYITALSYRLFGINDFSSVIFVLLTSIGNIILAYYFGKLLFNKKVGLMASFLISFFPLEVVYSTRLLTDVSSAFFVSLGVYLFLYSELKSKPKFFYISYILSGMFIGIGYLIRESALLIALFFLAYALFKKQIKKEYFLVAAGVLAIIALEILMFYKLTSNPFFKYTDVQDYLVEAHHINNFFGRLELPQGLLHYPYMILSDPLISHFYIWIIIAVVYFVFSKNILFSKNKFIKRQETIWILLWFLPVLLYLSFGSASFSEYLPFKAEPRYLSIITIPSMLLLSVFLMHNPFGRFKVFIIIALLFTSIVFIYLNKDRNVLNNLRELYSYLEKSSYNEIFIDKRSLQALDYISGYDTHLSIKEYPSGFKNIRGAYVIINNMMIRNLKEVGKDFPKEIAAPPKDWVKVKEIESRIIVYYIT